MAGELPLGSATPEHGGQSPERSHARLLLRRVPEELRLVRVPREGPQPAARSHGRSWRRRHRRGRRCDGVGRAELLVQRQIEHQHIHPRLAEEPEVAPLDLARR